jgi:hypothetical protein
LRDRALFSVPLVRRIASAAKIEMVELPLSCLRHCSVELSIRWFAIVPNARSHTDALPTYTPMLRRVTASA